MSACAVPEESDFTPSLPQIKVRGFAGDTVAAPAAQRQALGPGSPVPQALAGTIYLSFGGETLTANTDDSSLNRSEILTSSPTMVPKFNAAICAPKVSEADAITAVFDRVRTYYLPYAVTITKTRPASGNYTMITVGGKNTLLAGHQNAAGVAPLDCGNGNLRNVGFDFSDEQSPDFGGVVSVAVAAAHEAGHTFGLEHTDYEQDIMFSVDPAVKSQMLEDLFAIRFASGNYSGFNASSGNGNPPQCGGTGLRNNDTTLLNVFGAHPAGGDTSKPVLDWTFPPAGPQNMPLSIPIEVTATDNSTVRVEVYKNLELVAVLKNAPFATTLTAADKEAFYLTIEAIDTSANRATSTRIYQADAKNPTLCKTQASCATGRICKDSFCRLPVGSTCSTVTDCATSLCKAVGGSAVKTCTQVCTATSPCPTGSRCEGGFCVTGAGPNPTGKALGEACADGSECMSLRCLDMCVTACDDTTPCADGEQCIDVVGGKGCVPTTPVMMPKKGCEMGGSEPVSFGALMLLALAIAVVRRRLGNGRG